MQCRDKGQWRTMTKFEIRNNIAYASQMQFEAPLQARPQTVFNWHFWEKAAQDPKMTAYLNHGLEFSLASYVLRIDKRMTAILYLDVLV